MPEDFFIKIGIVGKFTDADLELISEGRGNINFIIKCELKVCFDFNCISFLWNLTSISLNSEKRIARRWTYLDFISSTLLSK